MRKPASNVIVMKETKAPLVGELSPQVTEGFAEFPTINLLMLFPNSSNPSDLAVLGHLPYRAMSST